MVLQYMSYSNFGVNYSFNAIYAGDKDMDDSKRDVLTSSAFWATIFSCVCVLLLTLITNNVDLFPKYDFSNYVLYIAFIVILQHFNVLLVNLSRLKGNLRVINIYYLVLPIVQLIAICIFRNIDLLFALIVALLISNIVGFLALIRGNEMDIARRPSKYYLTLLYKRGFNLLLYALSFYLIILGARTIVSTYYSVLDFSIFNLANSFSKAIFMLFGALNFLFLPKLLNVIRYKENRELVLFIEKIRAYYLTLTILIVFLSMISLPIVFMLLPEYEGAFLTLLILLLAQLLINNSFGFSTLLVQRGKEAKLTISALLSLVILLICAGAAIHLFSAPMEAIAGSVVVATFFYNIFIVYFGNKITKQFHTPEAFLAYLFKIELFFAVFVFIVLFLLETPYYINLAATILIYGYLNKSSLQIIIKNGFSLLKNDKLMDIK